MSDQFSTLKSACEILRDAGFETTASPSHVAAYIKHPEMINPADMRTKASAVLSEAGFFRYHLKEVYYFDKSKYPHRTDEYGYVELEPGDDFNRMTMTITDTTKKKMKFKDQGRPNPLPPSSSGRKVTTPW